MATSNCKHSPGSITTLFGVDVDPCRFVDIEKHTNVDIVIGRCKHCGAIDIEWYRTENTEDYILEEEE